MKFDEKQKALITSICCKELGKSDVEKFLYMCEKTGLDPIARQIYAVKRGGVMTVQVSIDGSRLIADRTDMYAPGKETVFSYDSEGKIFSATAFVMKLTKDGTWHEVSAMAVLNEYKAPGPFWTGKPHIMIGKCAENLALRRAFPAELSGLYVKEEMDQADSSSEAEKAVEEKTVEYPSAKEVEGFRELVCEDKVYLQKVEAFCMEKLGTKDFEMIPKESFDVLYNKAKLKFKK